MSRRSRTMTGQLPGWLNATLIFGTFAAVTCLELARPLRRTRQEKLARDVRNGAIALLAGTTVSLAEKPVVTRLTLAVEGKQLGLLKLVRLPVAAEVILSVLLLDYTLFIWHYLTHKVPFLWRFHKAHHADLDLDASTALRFHSGELILSVPWRAAQIALLGISPFSLALWQTLTLLAIMFHHSNLRLPLPVERLLCRLIVTPRMHGIHHSIVRAETDSNWSTIFSWPDYLHGTIRLNVPQDGLTLGVPDCQDPRQVTLGEMLALPFRPAPPYVETVRAPASIPATTLAG
ncbi:sterol desaturase family protein [Geomonas sp. Red32]|uniref:sterol desaturase family protein n=1 Tax=Geomonas sp. Red32 TaxID=2912856 RepID=UPI00202D01C0|nr:sterol desaturase family protein [Geomonas sp. Red32]